jgi:hypothetical protein
MGINSQWQRGAVFATGLFLACLGERGRKLDQLLNKLGIRRKRPAAIGHELRNGSGAAAVGDRCGERAPGGRECQKSILRLKWFPKRNWKHFSDNVWESASTAGEYWLSPPCCV